jgi:hypothetical protein
VLPESACEQCTDADAATAWKRSSSLGFATKIVDESHFDVALRRCSSCGQDWVDGRDPQDWLMIAVTATEAQSLADAGEAGVSRALIDLSPRAYLCRSWGSSDGAPRIYWTRGSIFLPRHD